jgi:hypothetical protein
VAAIESFVGQSLERLAGFSRKNMADAVRRFLETYNEPMETHEPDQGLRIAMPANLQV